MQRIFGFPLRPLPRTAPQRSTPPASVRHSHRALYLPGGRLVRSPPCRPRVLALSTPASRPRLPAAASMSSSPRCRILAFPSGGPVPAPPAPPSPAQVAVLAARRAPLGRPLSPATALDTRTCHPTRARHKIEPLRPRIGTSSGRSLNRTSRRAARSAAAHPLRPSRSPQWPSFVSNRLNLTQIRPFDDSKRHNLRRLPLAAPSAPRTIRRKQRSRSRRGTCSHLSHQRRRTRTSDVEPTVPWTSAARVACASV